MSEILSEVAFFRLQHALREEAAQQGLSGLAIGASHKMITARMERGAKRVLQLIEEGKHEEALAILNTDEWCLEEQEITSEQVGIAARSYPENPLQDFSLSIGGADVALLPDKHSLVVNAESGQFVLIDWGGSSVLTDGKFGVGELPLMLALLNAWPSYVENDKLLLAITGQSPEEITTALDLEHDKVLRLLRSMVAGCQGQLQRFGIEIQDVNGQGFKLSRYVVSGGEEQ